MDSNKLTMITLAAAGAAALALAPEAMACEECLSDPNNGGSICWSGFDYGQQYCWLETNDGCTYYCAQSEVCDEGQFRDCSVTYCGWDDYMCWGYGDCQS